MIIMSKITTRLLHNMPPFLQKASSSMQKDVIHINYAPINVKPAGGGGGGGGRAWGGDLIVFVGPGVGHLTDLILPGEGIFESFFARRGDI